MSSPGRRNWILLWRGPVRTAWRWTDPSQLRLCSSTGGVDRSPVRRLSFRTWSGSLPWRCLVSRSSTNFWCVSMYNVTLSTCTLLLRVLRAHRMPETALQTVYQATVVAATYLVGIHLCVWQRIEAFLGRAKRRTLVMQINRQYHSLLVEDADDKINRLCAD